MPAAANLVFIGPRSPRSTARPRKATPLATGGRRLRRDSDSGRWSWASTTCSHKLPVDYHRANGAVLRQQVRRRYAIDHCAHASHDPLEERNVARIRAGSWVEDLSVALREGSALVLAPGICHVPHRTALLSQLVTRNARGHPPFSPSGKAGGGARGSAAGARARRTAAKKQPQAGKRHEGCLQNEWIARARRRMRTCAGWMAPAPTAQHAGPGAGVRGRR